MSAGGPGPGYGAPPHNAGSLPIPLPLIVLLVVLLLTPVFLGVGLYVAALFSSSAEYALYKLHLLRLGGAHLLFSQDKKFKKPGSNGGPPDPGAATPTGARKRVVFLRHGESEWNVVFNQWSHGRWKTFPQRLFNALSREAALFTTLDSVFVDSPLSILGSQQALDVQSFLEDEGSKVEEAAASIAEHTGADEGRIKEILTDLVGGEGSSSVLVSSNLRRALSTVTIAFWQRLKRTQEKIHILSDLQEVTFNVDGVALSKPRSAPILSEVELKAVGKSPVEFEYDIYFDCSENAGDKPVSGCGIDRINAFASWIMNREENTVIAGGHSLYFRYFFQNFLPHNSTHVSKKQKIHNGGLVAFDLLEATFPSGKPTYVIDESSIVVLHGEFESDSKKSKKD